MDLIFDLLRVSCPFCLAPLGVASMACELCAENIAEIFEMSSNSPLKPINHNGQNIYSLGPYIGWLKNLILTQKKHPMQQAIRYLAENLRRNILSKIEPHPILAVPGKNYEDLHLVEHLLLELKANVLPKRILNRRFTLSSQKAKTMVERTKWDTNLKRFKPQRHRKRLTGLANTKVILFDDIVTTGSTLLSCKEILENEFQIEVSAIVCLAHTPKNSMTIPSSYAKFTQ